MPSLYTQTLTSSPISALSPQSLPDTRIEADLEPDQVWKDALQEIIQNGMSPIVEEAERSLRTELDKRPTSAERRRTFTLEYKQTMGILRDLAQDIFGVELERERQHRRWASGVDVAPDRREALAREQQSVIERIKGSQTAMSQRVGEAEPELSVARERRARSLKMLQRLEWRGIFPTQLTPDPLALEKELGEEKSSLIEEQEEDVAQVKENEEAAMWTKDVERKEHPHGPYMKRENGRLPPSEKEQLERDGSASTVRERQEKEHVKRMEEVVPLAREGGVQEPLDLEKREKGLGISTIRPPIRRSSSSIQQPTGSASNAASPQIRRTSLPNNKVPIHRATASGPRRVSLTPDTGATPLDSAFPHKSMSWASSSSPSAVSFALNQQLEEQRNQELELRETDMSKREEEFRRAEEALQQEEQDMRKQYSRFLKQERGVKRKEEELRRRDEELERRKQEVLLTEEAARRKEQDLQQREQALRSRELQMTDKEGGVTLVAAMALKSAISFKLRSIFLDVNAYKIFLQSTDADAQTILDAFQFLLDTGGVSDRGRLVVAMRRLSAKTNLYPKRYILDGQVDLIEDHPVDSGRFADIYKARLQGEPTCLKVVRAHGLPLVRHMAKIYAREAILWGQLSHPNLLPFYGLYAYRSQIAFVAPWAVNGNLSNYLAQNPNANRVLLCADTAAGVEYLHANGVVHGDIKGLNILVDGSGRACLSDFGLSGVTDNDIVQWATQSSAASKGGTSRWQAPELHNPEVTNIHNTKESDVFAWASAGYEIFTGNPPFHETPRETTVALMILRGDFPTRPPTNHICWTERGLTEILWKLFEDCWSTAASERPTMSAVISRLDAEKPGHDPRPPEQWKTGIAMRFRNAQDEGNQTERPSLEDLDIILSRILEGCKEGDFIDIDQVE
ncbi:hypothetical protein DXG01_002395 [Tephrocybe rancida]|nr:hypothetical protein DXG01_002395 [Tephrocybe rancida]